MSILQKLTEGVQSRDLRAEGAALLNKWEATGLLEGLNDGQAKQGMAVLLENQAKELLREASSMAAGDVEGFAAVAFPIVRRVFGGLIANDLISVQPMSLPSGLIFFLDFTHEGQQAGFGAGSSLYGGGVVGKEIVDGVSDITETGFYGLRSGYAAAKSDVKIATPAVADVIANPEDSSLLDYDVDLAGETTIIRAKLEEGDFAVQAERELIDPGAARAVAGASRDAAEDGPATGTQGSGVRTIQKDNGNILLLHMGPVHGAGDNTDFGLSTDPKKASSIELQVIRRLSDFDTKTSTEGLKVVSGMRLVVKPVKVCENLTTAVAGNPGSTALVRAGLNSSASGFSDAEVISLHDGAGAGTIDAAAIAASLKLSTFGLRFPSRDDINAVGLGALAAGAMPLEEPAPSTGNRASGTDASKNTIAEIDIKVDSIAVTAQTKKLKAKWSPELGQDLNAYHNLDAEVELTGILSEQIALEIDRELLGELVDGATAGTRYWSRAPGLFVDSTGAQMGAQSAAPDFTGTVSEWYETLIETINDVSAQIHRKTLRGGANFVVCSPEVANILEFTSGFRASVTADQDRGTIGAVKAGSLSKKFDVYVDPYFLRNVVLVGRKGSSFLESGYVYAPYVPLQVTPTIFGTEDFVPRKGVMTRYAKKMVRPDMYGLVVVRGLLGEEG